MEVICCLTVNSVQNKMGNDNDKPIGRCSFELVAVRAETTAISWWSDQGAAR